MMAPPTELIVAMDSRIPAALAPGAAGVEVAAITLSNSAAAGSGPITVEYFVIRAGDGDRNVATVGDAAAVLALYGGGSLAGQSDSLGADSTTAYLPLSPPVVLQPQETVELELLVDFDTSPRAETIRFELEAGGVGIRQPASVLLQIQTEAAAGQSFPMWTDAGSFNRLSLTGSYSNYPNPFAAGGQSTTFVYYLPRDAMVSLVIWTARGERVSTIRNSSRRPAGLYQDDIWDGRNGRGRVVVNGVYIAELKVDFASGGGERLLRKVAVVR
jgi:hypothetical protein